MPLLNGLEHMEPLRARFDSRVAAGTISTFRRIAPDEYRSSRPRNRLSSRSRRRAFPAAARVRTSFAGSPRRAGRTEREANPLAQARTDCSAGGSDRSVGPDGRRATRRPDVATSARGRSRRSVRGGGGRRRRPARFGTVGDHRPDGRRDDDLGGTRRRRGQALGARRDCGLGPASRRSSWRPMPDAGGRPPQRPGSGERALGDCARTGPGGIERVPQKNIRRTWGHPLLACTSRPPCRPRSSSASWCPRTRGDRRSPAGTAPTCRFSDRPSTRPRSHPTSSGLDSRSKSCPSATTSSR